MGWLRGLTLVVLAAVAVEAAEEWSWVLDENFGEVGRGRNEVREPMDVALAPDGVVAVVDRDREALVLFSDSGRWLRSFGGPRGEGDLSLRRPSAVGVDGEGRLWVVDTGNHRIVVTGTDGRIVNTVGSLGTAEGRFRYPSDVTFGRDGRVYVADTGNDRIQVFSTQGRFLEAWERRTGGRRDHLEQPVGLAYSDQGRGSVWVLNRGWTRLERFELDGDWDESLDLAPVLGEGLDLRAIEVEPAFYRMFLSDAAGGRVVAVDRRGGSMGEVVLGEGDGAMSPRGVAVTRQMEVYVADAEGSRVLRFKAR